MTKKRRCLLVGGALAICIAVVAGALLMLPERPGLSRANLERVEMGMTRVEVERILGRPIGQIDRIDEGEVVVVWAVADNSQAHVVFTNGVASCKEFRESTETTRDKLRRWAKVVW